MALTLLLAGLGAACPDLSPAARPQPPAADPRDADDAKALRYVERLTGGAEEGAALPLVLAVHGLGDDPEGFAGIFDGFDVPARVVLPAGPAPWAGGGFAWMPWSAPEEEVAREAERSADRLADLIREVRRRRPCRGKALVTGFSQGGIMSWVLALRHPDLVAGAVPVSGMLPRPSWPEVRRTTAGPPIRALHGSSDDVIASRPDRQSATEVRRLGWDARIRLYDGVPHRITRAMQEDLFALLRALIEGRAPDLPARCGPCPGEPADPEACELCPAD